MSLLHLFAWDDQELDDVLARCIMGWRKHQDYFLVMHYVYLPADKNGYERQWSPTTNIADTFIVAEKVKEHRVFVAIESLPKVYKVRVTSPNCRFYEDVISAADIPMQLSKLILKALLRNEEGGEAGEHAMDCERPYIIN